MSSRIVEPIEPWNFAAAVSSLSTIKVQPDMETLRLTEVVLDTIITTSDPIGSGNVEYHGSDSVRPEAVPSHPSFFTFFVQGIEFPKQLSDHPTKDYPEDFFRTLVRGPPIKITKNQRLSLRKGVHAILDLFMLAKLLVNKDEDSPSAEAQVQAQSYESEISELINTAGAGAMQRCFFITAKGYFSIVPSKVDYGDRVAISNGGPIPFVLRKVVQFGPSAETTYRLVGDGYVHGLMLGEALNLGTL